MAAQVTRLDNGMTVVTDSMAQVESCTIGVWVEAGARSEEPQEHGISHLLEHMAFKGTRRRSARAIAEEIESVGGEINAATGAENTSYYARVLGDDVPLAVDILADILLDSVLDEQELEREKHVILQEIGAAFDSPDDRVFDLFQSHAYPGQPIGRAILGTEATVSGFSREAIAAFLARHYRAPSMVLAAAGKVDHDRIVDLAGERFGRLPRKAGPAPVPARYRGGRGLEGRDLMEAQIVLGFEGRSYRSGDHHAAHALAAVLGGGMSSRLFQEAREARGLCYAISAFHWAFADTGLLGIHTATGQADVAELLAVVLGEIERVASDLGAAEVARAKAQMRAALLMSLESPAARAGQLARHIQLYGRILPLAELLDRIEAVTPEGMRRLAEEVLATPPTLASVGPDSALPGIESVAGRLSRAVRPAA